MVETFSKPSQCEGELCEWDNLYRELNTSRPLNDIHFITRNYLFRIVKTAGNLAMSFFNFWIMLLCKSSEETLNNDLNIICVPRNIIYI